MDYLDEWRRKNCGCSDQKGIFRDSIGMTHTAWVTRIQCRKHSDEYENLLKFFNEDSPILEEDEKQSPFLEES